MPYSFHSRFDDLPASHQGLLARTGGRSFYATRAWFETLATTTLDPHETLRLLAVSAEDGRALAVLPLVATVTEMGPVRLRRLAALANFYSIAFLPVVDPDSQGAAVAALARALDQARRQWDVIDLCALPAEDALAGALVDALAAAGFPVQRYSQFGNWYEDTAGMTAADYLSARPGALRSTLRRHQAKLGRNAAARFELVTGLDGLAHAVAGYQAVYARSWKEPEPYPDFIPRLARACAEAGALRLGVAYVDGAAAAAQLWIVWHGRATIFKLAHDEAFNELSLGSLLTWRMMGHVLDVDRVAEVDFGRGDDSYKKLWLPKRRDRWGALAFNTRTAAGALAAARHIGGRAAKRVLQPLFTRPPAPPSPRPPAASG